MAHKMLAYYKPKIVALEHTFFIYRIMAEAVEDVDQRRMIITMTGQNPGRDFWSKMMSLLTKQLIQAAREFEFVQPQVSSALDAFRSLEVPREEIWKHQCIFILLFYHYPRFMRYMWWDPGSEDSQILLGVMKASVMMKCNAREAKLEKSKHQT